MQSANTRRGPLGHRFLVFLFAGGVSLLSFWLLGYVLNDVDRIPRPDYEEIVTANIPTELQDRREEIDREIAENQRQASETTRRRDLLESNIANSQRTIDQLLRLKQSAGEDAGTDADQQTVLEENLAVFLDHQRQSQTLSDALVTLNSDGDELAAEMEAVRERIVDVSEPFTTDYANAVTRYEMKVAGIKLAVLVPLLLMAGWFFRRTSGGNYNPLIYAVGTAVAGRALLVMHEHFPAILFRYLLIGTALLVAIWVLVKLIQMVSNPAQAWLVKQYREAYATFLCPVCEFPIRRGPLKFVAWTRRSLRKQSQPMSAADIAAGDRNYTCPCCSTTLFESCEKCGETRHSMLPACEKCGDTKEVAAVV